MGHAQTPCIAGDSGLLLLCLGLWLGFYVPRLVGVVSTRRSYNTSTILQQVRTISELVTVQYVMEKVVILEDVKWIAGLGESRVLLLAHGIVKAGVDLGQLGPNDITVSGNKITVKLPPTKITEAYLDETQTRVIERTTGLLRTFDKDLEQNARVQAVGDIRRGARTSGILKDADQRAQAQLTALFKQLGFEEVTFCR